MIDWVDTHCQDWAQQYRNMGWPMLSDLETYDYIHSPDRFTPEAQELSLAVFRMRTTPKLSDAHRALIAHYLFAGSAKAKGNILGWDKNTYWRNLQDAHCYLAAKIDQSLQKIA